jgi:uncharacterized protein (DUF1778 family)
MPKSQRIEIRISNEALAAFDAEAAAEGLTRTAFLINSAWQRFHSAKPIINAADQRAIKQHRESADREIAHHAPTKAHQVAAAIPTVKPASSLANSSPAFTPATLPPATAYQRPKHAESCHCYACKPPAS